MIKYLYEVFQKPGAAQNVWGIAKLFGIKNIFLFWNAMTMLKNTTITNLYIIYSGNNGEIKILKENQLMF